MKDIAHTFLSPSTLIVESGRVPTTSPTVTQALTHEVVAPVAVERITTERVSDTQTIVVVGLFLLLLGITIGSLIRRSWRTKKAPTTVEGP